MIRSMLRAAIAVAALNTIAISDALSQDWNYFGACYSDDVILAKNGKYFNPCMGRGGECKREWEYGGTYRTLTDGVIEVYWEDENGNRQSGTYTHRRLSKIKCSR